MASSLLSARRFLPLFVTQFLGAFNDNLFKNAMVMLLTYRLAAESGANAQVMVTLAAGLFILPFFLFSATAGQMADAFDKAVMARWIKLAEIVLMLIAGLGFYLGHTELLFAVLFGMGVHSTFFGPIKYALLPQHLGENELLAGNAYIEAGTFLAILLGTILGGLLILHEGGVALVSGGVLLIALAGYGASRAIPAAPAPDPTLKISWKIFRETWHIIGFAREDRGVFLSIMGISWFWLVGATFLAQFPTFAKDVLAADETVVTLFLTVFSVGIGIGSILCNKLLKGVVQSTYVPIAALFMTVFMVDFYYASLAAVPGSSEALLSAGPFLQHFANWRILIDLFCIAVAGGVYIVPLYAIMQSRGENAHRARIIASNNVLNALFMVGSALGTLFMLNQAFTIPEVFLTIALLNAVVAVYICQLLPAALMRSVMRLIFTACYGVTLRGLEHYQKAGERVLLVANHTSFLDAALIAAFLPDRITFAVNTHIARKWWIKPFLALVDAYPLNPTNPMATKALIEAIRENRKCMIFPEGRITVTGALMKVYEGPGMIADKSGAVLLPIRIDGAQYTPFSRLKGKVRRRWFPRITLTILPPCNFAVDETLKGRARRQAAGRQLYDVMTRMLLDSSDYRAPLFSTLLDAMATHGKSHIVCEDIERAPLSYRRFVQKSLTLGRLLARKTRRSEYVGLFLPNAVSSALVFFGLQAFGRIPAMLNFSAGAASIVSACRTAGIRSVFTSRRFIDVARLHDVMSDLAAAGIDVHYLEDLRKTVTPADKIYALLALFIPAWLSPHARIKADDAAVVLFTSGSEGTPKGVVLSHANLQANRVQLASRVDFGPQDIVFNALPMFHAFGLTAATVLPLLSGIRVFFYPSPLHYRIVPELAYDTNATILFGTDTFLSGYAKHAHAYDFHAVRYVFAGAEKLREETRKTWTEKFGVRIFEGYGATECAPVLAVGTPMHNRAGTVGRLLPGIEYRLDNVPGIETGGQLHVSGPNIMLGYLKSDKPGELQPPEGGWYDTGDIVRIDEQDYISIIGRTKRFAKIAGEMVSLAAVEEAAGAMWPGMRHAAVNLPDAKKGEQIILVTEFKGAERDALMRHFRALNLSELSLPRQIVSVETLPLLGSGKTDYNAIKEIALRA